MVVITQIRQGQFEPLPWRRGLYEGMIWHHWVSHVRENLCSFVDVSWNRLYLHIRSSNNQSLSWPLCFSFSFFFYFFPFLFLWLLHTVSKYSLMAVFVRNTMGLNDTRHLFSNYFLLQTPVSVYTFFFFYHLVILPAQLFLRELSERETRDMIVFTPTPTKGLWCSGGRTENSYWLPPCFLALGGLSRARNVKTAGEKKREKK